MPTLFNDNPKYNAWLQFVVPSVCNLSCMYCSIGETNHSVVKNTGNGQSEIFTVKRLRRTIKKISMFGISTSLILYRQRISNQSNKMPPIDVKALSKSLDRTRRIFRIGFTGGGEPFLIPNIVEACIELSKRHYLAFNTNLTSLRVRELAERVDPAHASFHASLHIKELERRNLMDRFIETYHVCIDRGFPIYAQEVGHPSMLKEVESYRNYFNNRGINISFGIFKGEYQGKTYPESYTDEEIKCFGLDPVSARHIYRQKGKLCNVGYNVFLADSEGLITPCFNIPEHHGHMYGKLHFQKKIRRCPVEVCNCPFNEYDTHLFRLALEESFGRGVPEGLSCDADGSNISGATAGANRYSSPVRSALHH